MGAVAGGSWRFANAIPDLHPQQIATFHENLQWPRSSMIQTLSLPSLDIYRMIYIYNRSIIVEAGDTILFSRGSRRHRIVPHFLGWCKVEAESTFRAPSQPQER